MTMTDYGGPPNVLKRPLLPPPPPPPPPPVQSTSDTFSRTRTSTTAGRGSLAGWTSCPLCPSRSAKRFALGRGVAAHLHAVHTPWRLGKAEIKRREAKRIKLVNLARRGRKRLGDGADEGTRTNGGDAEQEAAALNVPVETRTTWTPTSQEEEAWGRKVSELTAMVEKEVADSAAPPSSSGGGDSSNNDSYDGAASDPPSKRRRTTATASSLAQGEVGARVVSRTVEAGRDRTGKNVVKSYRDSLPPFIKAAAEGNVAEVRRLVEEEVAAVETTTGGTAAEATAVMALLDRRDRNGSTAEHWAAGGGHLPCFELIHGYRIKYGNLINSSPNNRQHQDGTHNPSSSDKVRRRDGKTPLHYAARNGHDSVVTYLLSPLSHPPSARPEQRQPDVDAPSGDGTTPLHLACYGGHVDTVRLLIERYGADPTLTNEWGCGPAHWAAMSVHPNPTDVIRLCRYLRNDLGIEFHSAQRQGHSALHKAAQRLNRDVVQWLAGGGGDGDDAGAGLTEKERAEAGSPDTGGNRPSDIWDSVGGDTEFGTWMREERGW